MKNGHLSSNGYCFDIGSTVSRALGDFQNTRNPYSGPSDKYDAGNGSIMRLAPIPMLYAHEPEQAVHFSGESSRTTHQTTACIDACRYLGGILAALLNGESKEAVLSPLFHPTKAAWGDSDLCAEIAHVASGSFKTKQPPSICGSGYVVQSLEAALWAFHHSTNFRDGALMAVNLGNDADTTGAVYGQLAGACYGIEGIPAEWRAKISHFDLIGDFATQLHNPRQPRR
jgi:ADP-ribosylglycohydrolase